MKNNIKQYLASIGAKGGKASRRAITPEQQAKMQEARKASKANGAAPVKAGSRPRGRPRKNTTEI